MKNSNERPQFILNITLLGLLFFLIILNLFMIFIKSTSESYGITQNWKEYHTISNWNLGVGIPPQDSVDIDGDEMVDSIRENGCAFLSSVKTEAIPDSKRCIGQDYLTGKERIGQDLYLTTNNREDSLFLSFIVQSYENKWRYYEYVGAHVNLSEKDQNNIFQEIKPTVLDYIDLAYYQISHIFFRIFGFFFPIVIVIVFVIVFIIFIYLSSRRNKTFKMVKK